MRLHTDKITAADIHQATKHLPGVYAHITLHGSRSRDRAYEVRLEGNGYARNTGFYGANRTDETGATWDEWGAFLAYLYEIDPTAFWGSKKYPAYADANDYHFKTGGRFKDQPGVLPEDTHKRHTWDYSGEVMTGTYRVHTCKKCSAVQRTYNYGYAPEPV